LSWKLIVAQIAKKKCPVSYETPIFITVFIRSGKWTIPEPVESNSNSHTLFLRFSLILFSLLSVGVPSRACPGLCIEMNYYYWLLLLLSQHVKIKN
jgi:hypothetical protein